MKNYTTLGIVVGVALALCAVLGNWQLLLLAVLFATIGGLIGAHCDGRINVVELWNSLIGKGQG
ncbi:hypothetical protein [uncultured Corynebacterium sp.]|uniref:hypothetical protein n=1 Tax=uncultured Corynebacterium sp. TaxID=159447 RepID=UPI0025E43C44|nr:hypothetical protein [uncultured Corynebacterium sp.]